MDILIRLFFFLYSIFSIYAVIPYTSDSTYNDKVAEVSGCAAFVFFGVYIPILFTILILLLIAVRFNLFGWGYVPLDEISIDLTRW